MSYKAFISYSHAADNQLAPTLQSALQRFAKPFYRLRAINVFRDKTSLHLTPKLWPLIQQALRDSEYFILLASPDAAGSQWVQAEVDEWLKLKNGSLDNFLIVLTDGEIWWDRSRSDFDWNKTTALPLSLQGKFAVEPLFSDLRWAKKSTDLSLRHPQFLDDIGTIAATLHGKSKDVMIGKDVRQHRVFKLASGAAILVLLVSVMATSVAAYYANERRKEADQQREAAVRAANQEREARDYADQQRNIADEQRQKAELSAQKERTAKENETQQRKKAEEATKNEKVARQTAEERRVEAEHQRNIAEEQRQLAEEKSRLALSRQLSAQASNKLNSEFDLPLLLGVEASRASPTFEARSFLLTGLERNPNLITFLDGHKSAVHGVAFSPDGKTLVSGGLDDSLRLWDVASGRPIGEPFDSNNGGIWSVAFSPNGKTVAAGGFGTIILWDISRQPFSSRRLKPRYTSENVFSLAFSPDGKILAAGGGDLTLWDVASAKPIGEPLNGHERTVWCVAFSPDGKTLASGSLDKKIILWDVANHQPSGPPLTDHKEGVWSVAFSRDGRKMASGSDDGVLLIWDLATRTHLPPVKAETWVRSLALSADGETLLVGGNYGALARWYIVGSPFSRSFNAPKETVWTVALSPDENTFASGSDDGTVILWSSRKERTLGRALERSHASKLAFSPNGKTLVVGTDNLTIKSMDLTTGLFVGEPLRGHDGSRFAISPDGTLLATANTDGAVVLSVATGLPIGAPYPQRQTKGLAFSPNGKVLAVGGCGKSEKKEYRGKEYDNCVQGELKLWDWETHQLLGPPLSDHTNQIDSLAFSGNGETLASVGGGQFIIWDVARRQSLWSGSASSVSFSPDGRTLACGSGRTIALWNLSTHRRLTVFPSVSSNEWKSVAFSPDGRMLSATSNNKLVLWDVATRQPLWSDDVETVSAFSPDSKMLATIYRGEVTLWDLGLESWKTRACAIANRNLTLTEWEQYFEGEPYRKTCETLPINPSLLDEGIRLAKDEDSDSAVPILRRARELDPTLKFDPAKEARRLAAVGKGEKLLEKVWYLVLEMDDRIKEAIPIYKDGVSAYAQALTFGPTPELSGASIIFNRMCWQGSLKGHAAEVMDSCERAVAVNPSDWHFRDSRGLARALTGNSKGAIEDFQEFIKGTDDDQARAQRQRWINVLRAGKNPFTPEEIEGLLSQ